MKNKEVPYPVLIEGDPLPASMSYDPPDPRTHPMSELDLSHLMLDPRLEWRQTKNRWCYYCGTDLAKTDLTRDHVVPVARGGKGMPYNRVPACYACNHDKGVESLLFYLLRKPYGQKPPRIRPHETRRAKAIRQTKVVQQQLLLGLPVNPQSRVQRRAIVRMLLRHRKKLLQVLASRY